MNYDPTKDLICQVDTLIKSKTPIRPLTLEILLTTITDNYVFYDIEQEKKEQIYQISDKEDFVSPSQHWTALIKLEEIKKALEKYQGNGERKKQALQYIKKYKTNKK